MGGREDDCDGALEAAQAAAFMADPSAASAEALQSDTDAMLAWQMMQEDLQAQQVADQQAAFHQAQAGNVQGAVAVPGAVIGTSQGVSAPAVQNVTPMAGAPAAAAVAPKKGAKDKKKGKSCSLQ